MVWCLITTYIAANVLLIIHNIFNSFKYNFHSILEAIIWFFKPFKTDKFMFCEAWSFYNFGSSLHEK
jgi:hypothetical protein